MQDAPDKNCFTLPNGDCIGENCMHDVPKEEMVTDHPDLQKKELTLKDFKNYRRIYFTVRNATVTDCGHKLDIKHPPNRNCDICWAAFFQNNGELTKSLDEAFRAEGKEVIIRWGGNKFFKNFMRFMATIARLKSEENVPLP